MIQFLRKGVSAEGRLRIECIPMQDYRVKLESYAGPMDLLLYLIRRDEVDVYDIPISHILEQYLGYVRLLEAIDPESVGEFLVLAATLMEIKSRMLLPKVAEEVDDDDSLDPRADLVRQLLAYRSFRDAAGQLRDRAEMHAKRFGRPRIKLPDDEEQEVDIEDVQIWDLLTAFNKLMASVGAKPGAHEVLYDDTPISLHATDIQDRLVREGPVMRFEAIFEGRSRSEMVGLFLALLELIRQKRVRIDQEGMFESITVHLIDATPITDITDLDDQQETDLAETDEADDAFTDDAPMEEVGEEDSGESVFEDDDDWGDDDDEYSRQIDSVEIKEIDLGRSLDSGGPMEDDVEGEAIEDAPVVEHNASGEDERPGEEIAPTTEEERP